RSFIQSFLKQRVREMSKIAGRGLKLKTSIDLFVQSQLEAVAIVPGESTGSRYAVLMENGELRALRRLASGETLDPEGLSRVTSVEYGAEVFTNYVYEEKPEISANDLL